MRAGDRRSSGLLPRHIHSSTGCARGPRGRRQVKALTVARYGGRRWPGLRMPPRRRRCQHQQWWRRLRLSAGDVTGHCDEEQAERQHARRPVPACGYPVICRSWITPLFYAKVENEGARRLWLRSARLAELPPAQRRSTPASREVASMPVGGGSPTVVLRDRADQAPPAGRPPPVEARPYGTAQPTVRPMPAAHWSRLDRSPRPPVPAPGRWRLALARRDERERFAPDDMAAPAHWRRDQSVRRSLWSARPPRSAG